MKETYIGEIEEAEEWEVDNKYLKTGYRINYNSVSKVLKSLFERHNELVNIWTHLIGSLIFLGLLIYVCSCFKPMAFQNDSKALQGKMNGFLGESENWADRYKQERDTVNKNQAVLSSSGKGSNDSKINGSVVMAKDDLQKNKGSIFKDREKDEMVDKIHEFKSVLSNFDESVKKNRNREYEKKFGDRFENVISKIEKLEKEEKEQYTVVRLLESIKTSIGTTIMTMKETITKLITRCKSLHKTFILQERTLEVYPIWIFILTGISCMGFSTVYHLFFPISHGVYKTLHKLDHAGIAILNFGSSFCMFYYYFYCDVFLKSFYSGFIFINCMITFGFSMGEAVHKPRNSKWKAVMYASLGLSNVVPMVHLLVRAIMSHKNPQYLPLNECFLLLVLMAALYLFGLVIYSTKIPERFFERKCDIWFNSHGIWHCFVFAAALVHYVNSLLVYETRLKHVCS